MSCRASVWQDIPVMAIINMMAYFCFIEQLLVLAFSHRRHEFSLKVNKCRSRRTQKNNPRCRSSFQDLCMYGGSLRRMFWNCFRAGLTCVRVVCGAVMRSIIEPSCVCSCRSTNWVPKHLPYQFPFQSS